MKRAPSHLWDLLQPAVEQLDYEFAGAEWGVAENGMTLRVYIDRPKGIHVDDCAFVSRQISALLDVEDCIAEHYVLEVSSPGLERPLFSGTDFARFAGQDAKVRLADGVAGRKSFRGTIVSCDNERLIMNVDDQQVEIALRDIQTANLIAEL